LVITGATAVGAVAQSGLSTPADEQFVPQLGDIMNAVQVRHIKLYLAGKAGNWDLAAFESRQLMGNLRDAAVLYAGLPVSNVTTLAEKLRAVDSAVGAKDSRKFAEAYGELTGGCNACHQSLGRPFIVIKQPSDQPFGDQQFTRKGER
jgi:mono/diheme cytochrome c family protein